MTTKTEMARAVLKGMQGDQDSFHKHEVKTYARGVLRIEERAKKAKRKAAKASRKRNR